ncbi:MAG: carbon-nitrogen hydrolase family protein [Hyphomicrobiaceae bacterium]
MLRKLKVAAAQYPIGEPKSLAEWDAKITSWVAAGAATGAKLLVFPEYAAIEQAAALGPDVSGDLFNTLSAVADLAAHRIGLHLELAHKHDVHILVGSGPARSGDGFVNAAQFVTPTGSVGVQDKLIMTPFERDWGVSAGSAIRVFDTAIGQFGIAICYDSEFPLLVRAMAEAGAEFLLVPSCTERVSGFHRIRAGAAARALENQFAVITSPTVGDALWSPAVDRNSGSAGIFVPPDALMSDTGVVAEGVLNEPTWVAGEIDFARLRKLRSSGEMRNFADWAAQPGAEPLGASVEVVQLA